MSFDISIQNHSAVLKIQRLLEKIDCLRLPVSSRVDVQSILVRQVSKEIDHVLPWQGGHGHRTAAVALTIGQSLGIPTADLHDLKLASLLHDIGLLMLPHGLTADTRALEPESYLAVQNHPRLGAALLEPFSFLREAAVLIAHHHERWDGSGYPYGIRGAFIPLGARILAVADAFDAIAVPGKVDRSQRNLIAIKILNVSAGTQFDPAVVQALTTGFAGVRTAGCLDRE